MALRFLESFDALGTNNWLRKWNASRNSLWSGTTGRWGTTGWSGGERWARKDFDNQATWIVGSAVMIGNGAHDGIFGLLDNGTQQVDLRLNGTNLYVTRNGTQLGSAFSWNWYQFRWYYIEFKVTIDNTTGIAVVKIDGTTVINLSSQDTQNTANATANQVRIGSFQDTFLGSAWEDLYVCDGTGSAPTNDFLGDTRVQMRKPSGNGNSSQLVGSDGNSTDNYLLVDETADANDDTDYVESSTVGNKDTYVYEDLSSSTGTVYGVQIVPIAKKTDAGARSVVTVARLSATEVDGPVQTLASSYAAIPDIRETKPGGGTWTISDVNSAEFGIKVNA